MAARLDRRRRSRIAPGQDGRRNANQLPQLGNGRPRHVSCARRTLEHDNRANASRVRRIDWGLKADEYAVEDVPEEFHGLIKELKLKPARYKESGNFLRPAEVIFPRPGGWKDRIQQTRLKTSFIAEIHDTPYLLEISITQIWDKYKTKARPRTVWGMEIYGKHWDSAMNHVDAISRRKDWGEAQRNVWVGKDPNMWKRFQSFLEVVLHVQKHVEDIPPLTEENLENTESEAEE